MKLTIQVISSKKLLVEYNDELDFISKDGKLYFPITQESSNSKIKHLRSFYKNNKDIRNLEGSEGKEEEAHACVEEMVTGSTYLFFRSIFFNIFNNFLILITRYFIFFKNKINYLIFNIYSYNFSMVSYTLDAHSYICSLVRVPSFKAPKTVK